MCLDLAIETGVSPSVPYLRECLRCQSNRNWRVTFSPLFTRVFAMSIKPKLACHLQSRIYVSVCDANQTETGAFPSVPYLRECLRCQSNRNEARLCRFSTLCSFPVGADTRFETSRPRWLSWFKVSRFSWVFCPWGLESRVTFARGIPYKQVHDAVSDWKAGRSTDAGSIPR